MGSFHGFEVVRASHERVGTRSLGTLLSLTELRTSLEPKTMRTAAFRLLPRTLRSRALRRSKGRSPK